MTLRKAFPTPGAIACTSLSVLKSARKGNRPSEEDLIELQHLARQSIGIREPTRVQGLTFEQEQLIAELDLLQQHVETLDEEITHVTMHSREGQILTSMPGVGATQAAALIAMIGSIANFDRPAQLKAYCGWAPTLRQSGKTLDHAKLTPRGVRVLKRTMFLVVWHAIRHPDNEFGRMYQRLVPRKCVYDERKGQYVGKNKVVGRIAGQMITVMFTLLKRDHELLVRATGGPVPNPELYDPEIHRRHRAGFYRPAVPTPVGKIVQLPTA